MVKEDNIITLSREEAKKLIHKECKKRLGIDATEFLRKYKRNELPSSPYNHEIKMLLRLVYK